MKLKLIGSLALLAFGGAVAATSQANAATLHGMAPKHDSYTSAATNGHGTSEVPPCVRQVFPVVDDVTLVGLITGPEAIGLAGISLHDELFDGHGR